MSMDEKYDGGLWIAKGNRWLGLEPPADYEWQPLADRDFVEETAIPRPADLHQEWYPYDCLEWMKAADSGEETGDWGEFTIAIGDYDGDSLNLRNIEKFTVWRSDSMRNFAWWQQIPGPGGEPAGEEKVGMFPIFSINESGEYEVDERVRSELLLPPGSRLVVYERELQCMKTGVEGTANYYSRT